MAWICPSLDSYSWQSLCLSWVQSCLSNATPCRDIRSPSHPSLCSVEKLSTVANSTQEPTWFLHSGRDPSYQTSFQLEGNTTHAREQFPVSVLP